MSKDPLNAQVLQYFRDQLMYGVDHTPAAQKVWSIQLILGGIREFDICRFARAKISVE